jgi:hypothetical protein
VERSIQQQQQQHIPSYISYTTSPSKRIKMHFITSKLGSIEGLCSHRFWSLEPGNDPAWISELERNSICILVISNFYFIQKEFQSLVCKFRPGYQQNPLSSPSSPHIQSLLFLLQPEPMPHATDAFYLVCEVCYLAAEAE